MKILIAPDKFRGSFDSGEVAGCLAEGVRMERPDCDPVLFPMADGGEGTLEVLAGILPAETEEVTVPGPLGRPVVARWGMAGSGIALLESAQAIGLDLVSPGERDPLAAGTEGVGELIRVCLERGCTRVLLGLGGSATVDGGVGMARTLGYRFLDARGVALERGMDLVRLFRIDSSGVDRRLREVRFAGLCDVTTPLLGPRGAARLFGPQKGATPDRIPILEGRLERLALRIRADLGVEVVGRPMCGSAGGLGAGVAAFLGGELSLGVDYILERIGFEAALDGADLVLTGEGRVDEGTGEGKVVHGVWKRARARKVPVTVVCGEARNHSLEGARVLTRKDLPGRDRRSPLSRDGLRRLAREVVRGLS